MNKAVEIDETEAPLDPAMEKIRRKMIRLLMISIGVMMVGLMAVLFAIVYKMNKKALEPAPASVAIPSGADETAGTIALPVGAQINGNSISGTQILMDMTLLDGKRELMVFDVVQNRVIARYTLTNTR